MYSTLQIILLIIVNLIVAWKTYDQIKLRLRLCKLEKEKAEIQKSNILDDLSLATSEQLEEELRKRPNIKYIHVLPMDHKNGSFGINIESHNIAPNDVTAILRLAFEVTSNAIPSSEPDKEDEEENNEY